MADSENQIPTLTDIAHAGNQDMLNHFDGHQFDDEVDETELATEYAHENIDGIENANIVSDEKVNDIPSITIEDETSANLISEDFSDAMLVATNENKSNINDKALKQKIDEAIREALPGIEAQLKGKLYTKFEI